MTKKHPKAPTPEQLVEKDAKRRQSLMTGSLRRVRSLCESHVNPNTGGGVIILEYKRGNLVEIQAYYYKPNQTRQYFKCEKITSNQQRIQVLDRLQYLIDAEAAAKIAPHDLEIGEIICEDWGFSMNRPSFLKIIAVPDARKVEAVRLEDCLVWGDRQVGSVVPVEPHKPKSPPFIFDVSMANGKARLVMSSLSRAYRWNGKPASITSD
jgi:hypothetical protein